MTRTALTTCALLAALSGGCTVTRDLEPLAHQSERQAEVAYLELEMDGHNVGDAKIWAQEMSNTVGDRTTPSEVALNFRVRNDDRTQLQLEDVTLEVHTYDGKMIVAEPEQELADDFLIQPGEQERVRYTFELPPELELRDVESVELCWAIESERGRVTESVPFAVDEHPVHGRPYYYIQAGYYGGPTGYYRHRF